MTRHDEPAEGDVAGVAAVLADHEPVLGRFGPLVGIVGCSCLSARDYRAAGFNAGQEGWRAHVADALRDLLAAAWDEGLRSSRAAPNPYRATESAQ